jgi:NADH:ubiquinone oxidoreductase subunit 5 (subunit L)/multisubunit Na+/H+ antiporter MnhA subunit
VLLLIPLLPFLGFLANTVLRRRLSKTASGAVATGAMGLAFGVAVAAVVQMLGVPPVEDVRAVEE